MPRTKRKSKYEQIARIAMEFGTLYEETDRTQTPTQLCAAMDREETAYWELLEAVKNSLSFDELIRLTLAKVGAIQAGREKPRHNDLHAGIGALPPR